MLGHPYHILAKLPCTDAFNVARYVYPYFKRKQSGIRWYGANRYFWHAHTYTHYSYASFEQVGRYSRYKERYTYTWQCHLCRIFNKYIYIYHIIQKGYIMVCTKEKFQTNMHVFVGLIRANNNYCSSVVGCFECNIMWRATCIASLSYVIASHCYRTLSTDIILNKQIPGSCITWCCRENFSQWERRVHWKLCCHWLKGSRQR